jgi:ABC-type bacteriocin/lantibiotic exporter with double-glycine peptidase domain
MLRLIKNGGAFRMQPHLPMYQPIRPFFAELKKQDPSEATKAEAPKEKAMLVDNWEKNPYYSFYNREKVSRKEVREYLMPYFMHKDSKHLLYKSTLMLLGSKGLAITSPYILKTIVDSMTLAGNIDFYTAALGIGLFGLARVGSTMLQELRMVQIAQFINEGVRRVSYASFKHLHNLDLSFHKVSSKNTVFGINRAIRSIESGLRFTIGFFSPIGFEFILLCGMLWGYCGLPYLLNMLIMLGAYTRYSQTFSKKRVVYIRDRKNLEKKQEFY